MKIFFISALGSFVVFCLVLAATHSWAGAMAASVFLMTIGLLFIAAGERIEYAVLNKKCIDDEFLQED